MTTTIPAMLKISFSDQRLSNPHLNDDPGAIIAFPGETF
jgi:hypothetical protein